jgi:hypothetical protein
MTGPALALVCALVLGAPPEPPAPTVSGSPVGPPASPPTDPPAGSPAVPPAVPPAGPPAGSPADPPPDVGPDAHAQVRAAIAKLPPGPTLAEVQAAALAHAGIDARVSARWLARARRSAALPTITVQYDRRFDRGWTLDQEVGDPDSLRSDAGNQDTLRTKATWELDRLVFSPEELRAARATLDVADFRERLLVEVTRLYFERERLLIERALASERGDPVELADALDLELHLREIEGVLTGLTGLGFSPDSRAPANHAGQVRVLRGPARW